MSLDTTISLTTLDNVLSYLGIIPQVDGLWIYCSQAGATVATVQVTDTTIILIFTVGGVTTTNTLTFADANKDTLGELVTAINALTGWKAGRIYNASADSMDLVLTGALSCLGSANMQTLKIDDNYLLTELINRASDFLNRYCDRQLKSKTYINKRYSDEGTKLFLDDYPVTAIDQVCDGTIDALKIKYTSATARNAYARVTTTGVILTVDGTSQAEKTFAANTTLSAMATAIAAVAGWEATVNNSDYNSWPSSQLFEKQNVYALNEYAYLEVPDDPLDGYEEDLESGIIYLPSEFSDGFKNIFVSYTAGYSTIPASLEQICIELVKYKYDLAKKDSALQSERIGGVYAYTLKDLKSALSPDLLEQLDLFKRRMI